MTEAITDRQLEIIEAAGRILSSSGVTGLTTKRLAQEIQFSESALYRHFSSKDKIIIALLEHIATELDDRYIKACAKAINPEEQFKAIFQAQFEFFQGNPHFAVAVFSDGLVAENNAINKAVTDIMAVKTKYLVPVILEGQKKGIFSKELESKMILHITLGSVRLLMFNWRLANFDFNLKSKGKLLVNSLLKLITTCKN